MDTIVSIKPSFDCGLRTERFALRSHRPDVRREDETYFTFPNAKNFTISAYIMPAVMAPWRHDRDGYNT